MDSIPHDGGCSPIGVLSIWLGMSSGISALLLSDFAKPLARFHGVASQLKTLRIHGGPIQPPFLCPRTGALPLLQMMHARP